MPLLGHAGLPQKKQLSTRILEIRNRVVVLEVAEGRGLLLFACTEPQTGDWLLQGLNLSPEKNIDRLRRMGGKKVGSGERNRLSWAK